MKLPRSKKATTASYITLIPCSIAPTLVSHSNPHIHVYSLSRWPFSRECNLNIGTWLWRAGGNLETQAYCHIYRRGDTVPDLRGNFSLYRSQIICRHSWICGNKWPTPLDCETADFPVTPPCYQTLRSIPSNLLTLHWLVPVYSILDLSFRVSVWCVYVLPWNLVLWIWNMRHLSAWVQLWQVPHSHLFRMISPVVLWFRLKQFDGPQPCNARMMILWMWLIKHLP